MLLKSFALSLLISHAATAACQRHLWPQEKVVHSAIGILTRPDGRKLLLRRDKNDRSYPGKWSFPGGKLDPNESPEAGLEREFYEETRLRVKVTHKITEAESILHARDRLYVIHVYEVEVVKSDEVKLSDEHEAFAWVGYDEAKKYDLAGGVTREMMGLAPKPLKILITAGGTKEPLDTVRFLTNFSTGSFGRSFALAAEARGHKVVVLAPAEFQKMAGTLPEGVEHRPYGSTKDLMNRFEEAAKEGGWDIVLHSAAVSDYTPAEVADGKISSNKDELVIRLVKTPKLINRLREWFGDAFLVGFKLLSSSTPEARFDAAMEQMKRCRTDLCVENDLTEVSEESHKTRLVLPDGATIDVPVGSKRAVANSIFWTIEDLIRQRSQ